MTTLRAMIFAFLTFGLAASSCQAETWVLADEAKTEYFGKAVSYDFGSKQLTIRKVDGKEHMALTIGMLSLLGFPGTFGFIGKWSILVALVDRGGSMLAVILVLTSLVSAGYYLPVVSALWMKPGPEAPLPPEASWARSALVPIVVATIVVVALGVWPGPVLDWATTTAQSLGSATAALAGAASP